MGTSLIHICTGTRDRNNMWRRHPDNNSPEAWRVMAGTVREATEIARQAKVVLAFEPEVNNVVDSARKARQLLNEIGSPHLKVTIDAANPALGITRRFLERGPQRLDVGQLGAALRVEPAEDGTLLFAVVREGRVENFREFADFVSRVSSLLGSGRNMRSLTARGAVRTRDGERERARLRFVRRERRLIDR